MASVSALIRELATYALSKRSADQSSSWLQHDPLEEPHLLVKFVTLWNEFFELDREFDLYAEGGPKEIGQSIRLPVLREVLARHRQRFPVIRESEWMERDGHVLMEIPVDSDIPIDYWKSLIDDAHAIIWRKLDAKGLRLIELAELPYDERALIDHLIQLHGLSQRRREIHQLARNAISLRTVKYEEREIPLGASKMGGQPDLPPKTAWPLYRDGKPLAFLVQINLNEIARLPPPFPGLPKDGLLSFFSVWGWQEEGDPDPISPADHTWRTQEDSGWTVVIHTSSSAELERRSPPENVNSFRAALIEPAAMLSLPNHRVEPPVAALGWPDELWEKFDWMQYDHRALQMHHCRKQGSAMESEHMFGGYAAFQQEFPTEVLEKGLAMFLQITSDGHAGMGWSDGGELTFYACPKALAAGRVERVWGTCQGG